MCSSFFVNAWSFAIFFIFLSLLVLLLLLSLLLLLFASTQKKKKGKKYESSKMHSCSHLHIYSISSALNHFFATIKSTASCCRVVHVNCSLFVHKAKQRKAKLACTHKELNARDFIYQDDEMWLAVGYNSAITSEAQLIYWHRFMVEFVSISFQSSFICLLHFLIVLVCTRFEKF